MVKNAEFGKFKCDILSKFSNFAELFWTIGNDSDTCYKLHNYRLVLQVVAEYERAVIFRLGRLRKGGSKGPGIFTVIPCIDTYRCVDLRTVSFDVPPQEVSKRSILLISQKVSQ